MKLSQKLLPLVALTCLYLTGCSQSQYEMGVHFLEEDIPSTEESVSLQQVLDQLGPPLHISATHNGYVMAWEHWLVREQSLGLSLGSIGFDLLSIDVGDLRIKGEHVLVAFDQQHMLLTGSYSTWDTRVGRGMAIQPSMGIGVDIIDSDDLIKAMTQHEWGAFSLSSIAKTLNQHSTTKSGQNGLEQRGTPEAIGQHSLGLD